MSKKRQKEKILPNNWLVDETTGTVVYRLKRAGRDYYGVSRCNKASGDEFNEEFGKKLSRLRAAKESMGCDIENMRLVQLGMTRGVNDMCDNGYVNPDCGSIAIKSFKKVFKNWETDVKVLNMKYRMIKDEIRYMLRTGMCLVREP